jgi:hypothetical protein
MNFNPHHPRASRRQVLTALGWSAGAVLAGQASAPTPAHAAIRSSLVRSMRSYSDCVLSKGPVGYWRLGEAVGPIATDASGRGSNGVYHGTPTFGQAGAIVNDQNTAVRLNGPASRDYVEISASTSAIFSQPTSGLGLTVEVWMRPNALIFTGETANPYVQWLGKGVHGQHEWGMRFYSRNTNRPNRISAYIWNPQGGEGAGAYFEDKLSEGTWIHVVACYEPGDAGTDPPAGVHIYRDGVHRLGPPSPGTLYRTFNITPVRGTAPVRLGTRDGRSFLTGGLDEVAIYPRVLTPDEILENYYSAGRHT